MFSVGAIFIPVTDLKILSEWYKHYFEMKEIEDWDWGVSLHFPTCAVPLCLIKATEPKTVFKDFLGDSVSYFNFSCDDIASAYNLFKDNHNEVTEIEDHDEFLTFNVYDPDRNLLTIIYELPESTLNPNNIKALQNLL